MAQHRLFPVARFPRNPSTAIPKRRTLKIPSKKKKKKEKEREKKFKTRNSKHRLKKKEKKRKLKKRNPRNKLRKFISGHRLLSPGFIGSTRYFRVWPPLRSGPRGVIQKFKLRILLGARLAAGIGGNEREKEKERQR